MNEQIQIIKIYELRETQQKEINPEAKHNADLIAMGSPAVKPVSKDLLNPVTVFLICFICIECLIAFFLLIS